MNKAAHDSELGSPSHPHSAILATNYTSLLPGQPIKHRCTTTYTLKEKSHSPFRADHSLEPDGKRGVPLSRAELDAGRHIHARCTFLHPYITQSWGSNLRTTSKSISTLLSTTEATVPQAALQLIANQDEQADLYIFLVGLVVFLVV